MKSKDYEKKLYKVLKTLRDSISDDAVKDKIAKTMRAECPDAYRNDTYGYIYKVVEEWATPTYVDPETSKHIFESYDAQRLSYWVVIYDPIEKEIIGWVEQFQKRDEAYSYCEELNKD